MRILAQYVTRKTHICLNVLRMEFPHQALLACFWSQMVAPKPTWCLLDSTIHLADTTDIYPIVLGRPIVAVWQFSTNSRISLETRSIGLLSWNWQPRKNKEAQSQALGHGERNSLGFCCVRCVLYMCGHLAGTIGPGRQTSTSASTRRICVGG